MPQHDWHREAEHLSAAVGCSLKQQRGESEGEREREHQSLEDRLKETGHI